jgi:NADH dehydrogenase/NADH:ubiquinone oxidoreductase subunit G
MKFTLDDKELEVEEGTTILQAAKAASVKIPTLCDHDALMPYGACRLCMVEIVDGARPGLAASCLYKVIEGLVVKTETESVKSARKIMFELLLGRCKTSERLNTLAAEYGVTESRIKFAEGDEDKCIQCGLCVRVCDQVSEREAQSFAGRGIRRRVQTPFGKVADRCIGCGACAYLCPTKIITITEAE